MRVGQSIKGKLFSGKTFGITSKSTKIGMAITVHTVPHTAVHIHPLLFSTCYASIIVRKKGKAKLI